MTPTMEACACYRTLSSARFEKGVISISLDQAIPTFSGAADRTGDGCRSGGGGRKPITEPVAHGSARSFDFQNFPLKA